MKAKDKQIAHEDNDDSTYLGTLRHELEADVYLTEGELEGQTTKEVLFNFLCDKSWPMNLRMQMFTERFKSEDHVHSWLSSMEDYISYFLPQRLLSTASLVIDEAMCFASEKHQVISIDKADLIETHIKLTAKEKRKALRPPGPGRRKGSLTKRTPAEKSTISSQTRATIIGAMSRLYLDELTTPNKVFQAEDVINKTNVARELSKSRRTLHAWLAKYQLDFEELKDQAIAMCRKNSR